MPLLMESGNPRTGAVHKGPQHPPPERPLHVGYSAEGVAVVIIDPLGHFLPQQPQLPAEGRGGGGVRRQPGGLITDLLLMQAKTPRRLGLVPQLMAHQHRAPAQQGKAALRRRRAGGAHHVYPAALAEQHPIFLRVQQLRRPPAQGLQHIHIKQRIAPQIRQGLFQLLHLILLE